MKTRTLITLAAAVVFALACRANESLEGQAKDAKIAAQIKSKLAQEVGASTITSVNVNVTNGVVTLAGPVHSADESSRIETVARGVAGVTDVKNALQILAPDRSITPSSTMSPPPAPTPAG